MSDNIDKLCYVDLIKKGKIRIPQIQRDYVQGRKHKEVKEIRNHFVCTSDSAISSCKKVALISFYSCNVNGSWQIYIFQAKTVIEEACMVLA